MNTLDLAVIGNCAFSALIDRTASVVWSCIPRFDGDPVFCSLLDGADGIGHFDIVLDDFARSEQHYLHNTALLTTDALRHPRLGGGDHRLRAPVQAVRPDLPAGDDRPASSDR